MTPKKIKIHHLNFEEWLPQEDIEKAVKRLAEEIMPKYQDMDTLVIGVLNGAVFFTVDLIRQFNFPFRLDFVQAASYQGMESTGKVEVTAIKEKIEGSHVLLVEDIVDTGRTIQVIKNKIQQANPASIEVASLFYKPDADENNNPPDYIGFSIPNHFILGYGLDYDGLGRELRDVYKVI